MIQQDIMYFCQCDNCGETWYNDHSGIAGFATRDDINNEVNNDEDWQSDGVTHYCKECWTLAGEDEKGDSGYEINLTRKKEVTQSEDLTKLFEYAPSLLAENKRLKEDIEKHKKVTNCPQS